MNRSFGGVLGLILLSSLTRPFFAGDVLPIQHNDYTCDPEYLRLRTELVNTRVAGHMQITPEDYIWKADEAKTRRCLELAEEILEMMAWCHFRLGNMEGARRAAGRTIELHPGDEDGKRLLEMIERGPEAAEPSTPGLCAGP